MTETPVKIKCCLCGSQNLADLCLVVNSSKDEYVCIQHCKRMTDERVKKGEVSKWQ